MDEAATELVRDWLTRASHDLQAARVLATADPPLLDAAIYHCQQAAEKAVKAWLQSKDDPLRKTHDIEVRA
jgi:HEPN domain-containing protein